MREIMTLIRNCGGYVYSRGESIILGRGKSYLAERAGPQSKDECTGSPLGLGKRQSVVYFTDSEFWRIDGRVGCSGSKAKILWLSKKERS